MCIHNEDDYDCSICCFRSGESDARDKSPRNPEYKNFDQCDDYHAGYDNVISEIMEIAHHSGKRETVKVEDGNLIIDGVKFSVSEPDEPIYGLDVDGRLQTLFRGHMINTWDWTDVKGSWDG